MKSDIINLFDKDRTLNAVLYIIEHLGGRADMHTIFKTLYFADQRHLSLYGRTITGDVYIAMEFGPVPSKTDDIFKAIRGDSYFHDTELNKFLTFTNRYVVAPAIPCDTDYLSPSDMECLDYALALIKNKDFSERTRFSHGLAWQSTARDHRMSYSDILREAGDSEQYIDYINNKIHTEAALR